MFPVPASETWPMLTLANVDCKACDLCYRRKINSDCTYKAASRKTPSRKQAAAQRQLRDSALQSRVKVLEDQLSSVLEKVERLEKLSTPEHYTLSPTPESVSEPVVLPRVSNVPALNLPPYEDVLPLVKHYLTDFNSLFPLFHSGALLQLVKSWYQDPHSRNPVIWALINVVLALAHHTSSPGEVTPIGITETYLNNAQLVLTEVIMSDTGLVNVQVLLGLVILFWTADDARPALFLVATALRLAHRLGLHTRKCSQHLPPASTLQRDRVFWMAYILDREISLHAGLAPVQNDSDIDLDLPPSELEDDPAGFIFASDGYTRLNFFRARIELARIQGQVYECVYSASAQNCTPEERSRNVACISDMLDDWTSRILPDFRITTLLRSGVSGLSRNLCILHSTRLSCRALITFASAWDSYHYSTWMGRLQDYGDKMIAGQSVSRAPVPQGWQTLVNECREYIKLYATVTPRDIFFIRAIESDKELAKTSMLFLEDTVKQNCHERIRNMVKALKKLEFYADLISQKTTHEDSSSQATCLREEPHNSFLELPESRFDRDVPTPNIGSWWGFI
ncbi:hypothetical protein NECHADRAFT_77135 [Paecilomyces variotii No. 5]|uniref:Xylanolytic transcriptional activator regulatory domain-containing protein n=1 Tax=Byssochlamys spectabilis (strain No. 5 / NBRC 109023) TaxID=1356009 RepID=V5FUW5_BYSSN|nr:hypothetical protein NECHADRAFT_77135 [Paecilomyces variotii No. 5]